MLGNPHEVAKCVSNDDLPQGKCPLYDLRSGKRIFGTKVLKVIRAKCFDCSGFSESDVRECEFHDCELYPFRMGKNPNKEGFKHSGSFRNSSLQLLVG